MKQTMNIHSLHVISTFMVAKECFISGHGARHES